MVRPGKIAYRYTHGNEPKHQAYADADLVTLPQGGADLVTLPQGVGEQNQQPEKRRK